MTLLEIYQEKIHAGKLSTNLEQKKVVEILDTIYHQLLKKNSKLSRLKIKKKATKGLYLWGPVGTGKTLLINLFYQQFPLKKMRLHFHEFMQRIHHDLTLIQGQKNPLKIISKKIAKETKIICFDEFFVKDIADAMLLGKLLNLLFKKGVCLIASSNIEPDELYKNGLQRELFLPTISLIKKHTQIIHLHAQDYRMQYKPAETEKDIDSYFNELAKDFTTSNEPLFLLGRKIQIIKKAGPIIWFDFYALCDRPRSQKDYLEIAQHYHTVLISGIPRIRANQPALITSFIHLIDILYEKRIRTIFSSDVDINEIYTTGPLQFEYQRTKSRLIEMKSEHYERETQVIRSKFVHNP